MVREQGHQSGSELFGPSPAEEDLSRYGYFGLAPSMPLLWRASFASLVPESESVSPVQGLMQRAARVAPVAHWWGADTSEHWRGACPAGNA